VKRVIRSSVTGLYLRDDGSWTDDSKQAKGFLKVTEAIAARLHYELRDCDLVLQVGLEPSAEYDVVIPLA
jgi:hypothetical protein